MRDLQEISPPDLAAAAAPDVDPRLRRYLLAVYAKVGLGLVLAAGLAHVTSSVPGIRDLMFSTAAAEGPARVRLTTLGALVAIAPIVLLLLSGRALSRPTPLSTGAVYWSVVALFGASMGVMVLSFTGLSIATTLAISAAAFGSLSLFGYTTRRDLTGLGSFLTVGLVGLVLALLVNLLLRSPAVLFIASIAGTFVFAGLIAWDTQRLKSAYYQLGGDQAALGVASNYGALSLFINFLNLFQFLLMALSGERR